MRLVTNIEDIEKLATEKEKENWRFRCFLKGCDLEVEELDAIVHRLNDMVSAKIDCQSCGNCCRAMRPVLKPKDIKLLAAHLSMPPGEFEKEYLVKDDEGEGLTFQTEPCPFLSGNSCTVYSARPENCRSYPHLHKKDFVFRTIGIFHNCSCCPIVYNVYELLKEELRDLRHESHFDDYEYEQEEMAGNLGDTPKFFNDDGKEINPDLASKPSLCVSCMKDGDPNEEILCTLNRLDQQGEDDFQCEEYMSKRNN